MAQRRLLRQKGFRKRRVHNLEQAPDAECFRKLGDLKLLGIPKPVEHSGIGLAYRHPVAFTEDPGRVGSATFACQRRAGGHGQTGLGTILNQRTSSGIPHANDRGRARLLDLRLGASSRLRRSPNQKTITRKDGGDHATAGSTMWITHGRQPDRSCLPADFLAV